jgi:hypothetical protein
VIFVLAGAKPVSMRYDRALMSIGCPSMRWFLGLFLCRLVPVRRWLQTFILWLSGLLSVGLRQWNHLIELIPVLWKFDVPTFWLDPSVWPSLEVNLFGWLSDLGDPFDAVNFCCWDSNWGSVNLVLLRQHCCFRRRPILYKLSSVWFAVGRLVSLQWLELSQTCLRWDRSRSIRFSSEVNLLFFRVGDGSLLRSIRRFLRWASSLNAVDADGFHLELVCGIVDG